MMDSFSALRLLFVQHMACVHKDSRSCIGMFSWLKGNPYRQHRPYVPCSVKKSGSSLLVQADSEAVE